MCYNDDGDIMYIINYKPKDMKKIDYNFLSQIEQKIFSKEYITSDELDYFLLSLVYRVRIGVGGNLLSPCVNTCDIAQSMISSYLNRLGVLNHPCMTQNVIVRDIVGHNFVTAHFYVKGEEQLFLIDPTYQQFLLKEDCSKDKIFYYDGQMLIKPSPGFYIKEENYPLIETFINQGYYRLNDEFIEIYGNSFYNTKLGRLVNPFEFKTIPGKIYQKTFIKGNEKLSLDDDKLKNVGLFIPLSIDIKDNELKKEL